jgi:ribonuclease E
MVALHGREDALLDLPRFLRLLRQANDAEIADVRQVSDGEFEVAPHRLEAAQAAAQAAGRPQVPAPREPIVDAPTLESPVPDVETDGRNGQRFGIRFRRGSRGGVRMADVPLIGVVHVDAPDPVLETLAMAAQPPVDEAPAARGRARATRKRAGKPKASPPKAAQAAPAAIEPPPDPAEAPETDGAPPAAPRRRARPRARRKAE